LLYRYTLSEFVFALVTSSRNDLRLALGRVIAVSLPQIAAKKLSESDPPPFGFRLSIDGVAPVSISG